MRREGREQLQERSQHGRRLRLPRYRFVGEDHERADGGVEAEAVQIFRHLLDGGMQRLELRRSRWRVHDRWIELDQIQQLSASLRLCGCLCLLEFSLTLLVHEESPHTAEETIDTLDALGVPRLH